MEQTATRTYKSTAAIRSAVAASRETNAVYSWRKRIGKKLLGWNDTKTIRAWREKHS